MASGQMRQQLWNAMLHVDRNCRYYEKEHAKNTVKSVCFRTGSIVLVLIASGLAVVFHLWTWLYAVGALLGVIAAILTVCEVTLNYSTKASVAHAIYVGSAHVRLELEELWGLVEGSSINDEELRHRMRDLTQQLVYLEGWAGVSGLTPDQALNERITRESYEYVPARYNSVRENA